MARAVDLDLGPAIRKALASAGLHIVDEVLTERRRQNEKWGQQDHRDVAPGLSAAEPPGPGARTMGTLLAQAARYYGLPQAGDAQYLTDHEASAGQSSWVAIATEELAEALEAAALGDEDQVRTELIQLAAVCVQWVQAIDRRRAGGAS